MDHSAPNPSVRSTSLIIIPARLASTRLPRKLLLRETGKSLLRHTYEAAARASRPSGVCVACDCAEILDEVRSFGGQAEMTDPAAASGTDRVAEVARRRSAVDIVVNVQGDEPEIAGQSIDLAIRLLEENPEAMMSTLATPIRDRRQLEDPACVKVVFDVRGRALYFSRSPIPCARVGRRVPHSHRTELLSACGPVRIPPRFSPHNLRNAARGNGKDRKAGTASSPQRRLFHTCRSGGRGNVWDQHAGRLSGVREETTGKLFHVS